MGVYWRWAFINFRQLFGWAFIGGGRLLETGLLLESIRYVRVFKSLCLTEINALYTYNTHQFEALQICRQMLLLS